MALAKYISSPQIHALCMDPVDDDRDPGFLGDQVGGAVIDRSSDVVFA